MKRVLYFHGFASSPHGRKVDRLRGILEPEGFEIVAPDMNVPSFRWLDFEEMVTLGAATARERPPDVIVGSSLGSLVALSVARECSDVPIVLIAPAFAIGDRWMTKIPAGDPITVFNYATNGDAQIHRRFFEQMSGIKVDERPPTSPVTVLMGRLDESIPFDLVEGRWNDWVASGRLAVGSRFTEIPDGDHGLVEFSDRIADAIRES
jgi:pimeloyl-ACP methyl ester carboxylesterase